MTKSRIRLASDGDLDAIARFAGPAVHDAYDHAIGRAAADRLLADWWGDTLAESVAGNLVHIAVDGDEVVGMVELGEFGGDAVVWKLYVAAGRRSAGLGSSLLRVATEAIGPGPTRVILEHLASNVAAGRFYDREGFEIIRVESSDDPADDLVWRARPLARIDGVPAERLI